MREICVARRDGRQEELPVARPRKALPVRETNVVMLTNGRRVLMERRPPAGIWGGLLVLPECMPDRVDDFARRHGCRVVDRKPLPTYRHTFSHFHLNIMPLVCHVEAVADSVADEVGMHWLAAAEINQAAVPTPVRHLLRDIDDWGGSDDLSERGAG